MAEYKFVALDKTSKKVKGTATAVDSTDLALILKEQNLYLVTSQPVKDKETKSRVLKLNELSLFSREIGTMTSAGVPLVRAIEIMTNRDIKPALKKIYLTLLQSLRKGNQLSYAMEEQTGVFPELMINMYRSGEESGHLDSAAMKMAQTYDKEFKLQNTIRSAMVYPIILCFMLVAVVLVVFTFILPQFFVLFDGIELPTVTKVVMGISHALTNYWYIMIVVIVLLIIGIRELAKAPKFALSLAKTKLKMPLFGKLFKTIYTARFARTLSSLYASGLSIVESVAIASKVIGNKYILSQFEHVRAVLLSGGSLSSSINTVDGFDTKLTSTVQIGEETGKLDEMLDNIADSFDYEAEIASTRMVKFIEPIFIIIMAVVVGFVVLSVLLPILTLYQSIG